MTREEYYSAQSKAEPIYKAATLWAQELRKEFHAAAIEAARASSPSLATEIAKVEKYYTGHPNLLAVVIQETPGLRTLVTQFQETWYQKELLAISEELETAAWKAVRDIPKYDKASETEKISDDYSYRGWDE